MYAQPFDEGDYVDKVILIGLLPDSREVPLSPGELGLGAWIYAEHIDLPRLCDRVESYNATRRMGLVRLRVESQPMIVTRYGISLGSSRVLLEAKISTPE
jgi:hypothetical protein